MWELLLRDGDYLGLRAILRNQAKVEQLLGRVGEGIHTGRDVFQLSQLRRGVGMGAFGACLSFLGDGLRIDERVPYEGLAPLLRLAADERRCLLDGPTLLVGAVVVEGLRRLIERRPFWPSLRDPVR